MLTNWTLKIEIALSRYFNPRVNLIVPNVSWGLYLHEIDMLILTKNNYAYEVEIKISRTDLRADLKKLHGHYDNKISRLFFAIPIYLTEWRDLELIPDRAGVLVIDDDGNCKQLRHAKVNHDYKFTPEQRLKLAHLGCMRIWNLKKKILKQKEADHDTNTDVQE